ncbi:VOC family protein [Georgenia halophila]|uniref:VOC family protein n=1 Tax=Georgenia halophila TaxID=620889 RepID=A0ABP8LJM5_9MICO
MQLTFDATDPGALATFWAEVLGYKLDDPPAGFASWDEALEAWGVPEERRNDKSALVDPEGRGPRLFFQKVPEQKVAKNRLHLDVRSAVGLEGEERMAAFEARAAELVELGATRVKRFEPGGLDAGHIVMQDPDGNEFCLD